MRAKTLLALVRSLAGLGRVAGVAPAKSRRVVKIGDLAWRVGGCKGYGKCQAMGVTMAV